MAASVYDYNILKSDFFDTAVADVLRAVDGGAGMGSFILALCCVDYMGLALSPSKEENTSADFKLFITSYMASINPSYTDKADMIWAVRCGLAHVYGASSKQVKRDFDFKLAPDQPDLHLRLITHASGKKEFWINLPAFIAELIASVESFFRDKKGNDAQLLQWASRLLVLSGAGPGLWRLGVLNTGHPSHKASHPFLALLDNDPPLTPQEIRDQIFKQLTDKLS